jgi:CRISPR/Cas system-associated exonuclease Cas4 (RecB family)
MTLKELSDLVLQAKATKHPTIPLTHLVKPKYSDKKANSLTKAIIDLVKVLGGYATRINTMGRPIDNRRYVTDVVGFKRRIGSVTWIPSSTERGTADIQATINGKSVSIEVKVGNDRLSAHQVAMRNKIQAAGGIYLVAKNFEQISEEIIDLANSKQ